MESLGEANEVLFASVDGGCDGVRQIQSGNLDATAQQYPAKMAELGVEAMVELVTEGAEPTPSDGLDYYNTGVKLVTDQPADGVESITSDEAAKVCWG
jgi:fructose transport system substrate-binding protein